MPDTWPTSPPSSPSPPSPPSSWPEPPGPPPTGPGSQPPGPPSRGRIVAGALVGLLIVAVLAVTAALAIDDSDGDDLVAPRRDESGQGPRPADPGPSTTAPGAPSAPTDLDAAIDEAMAFVEAQRGHAFVERPVVEALDDEAFIDRYNALIDEAVAEDPEAIAAMNVIYRAFGLIEPDADIVDVERSFGAAGVLGFYDTKRNELVVRSREVTPFTRTVLVHELTHALDDQLFELYRPEYDDADDEIGFGLSAVAEGNARRVENAFRATLTAEERRAAEREEGGYARGLTLDDFTLSYLMLQVAPYERGLRFVEELVERGGEAAVDAALREPPRTSEQVLDFDAWLSKEPRTEVPAPPADGTLVEDGVVGQVALEAILTAAVSPPRASLAAEGWAGDWFVAWQRDSSSCVRATFVMETTRDHQELRDALDRWVDHRDEADLTDSGDQLTLTTCAG